jgi:uncharacterized protein
MKPPRVRLDRHKFGPWAIVTGASSGIGEEFARQLAASGLNVVLVARRLSVLESLGQRLAAEFGVEYRAVGVDLSDDGLLGQLEAATHDLDVGVLISSAGAVTLGEFLAADGRALQRGVRLNVMSHVVLARHFAKRMAVRGRGGVLLVSSTAGAHGSPFIADYAAAKGYLLVLGEALHLEFKRMGLHMTVLMPGPTDTPGVASSGIDVSRMPGLMSVQQCVTEGLAALNANRATHIAGRMNRIMAALIPRSVMRQMMGAMLARALAASGRPEAGG